MRVVKLLPKRYASCVAFIMDILLVNLLLLWPLNQFMPSAFSSEIFFDVSSLGFIMGVSGLVYFLYFSLFEYYLGQTLGMRAMGIFVDVNNFYQAGIRNLFIIPLFPFSLIIFIDLFYFIRFGYRWSDTLTNTKLYQRVFV
jgi:uncharacterized RDD family membrane protein YckC